MTDKELLSEARDWLKDCVWADMNESDFDRLTDVEVRRGVDRHWDGGWSDFVDAVWSD